MATIVFVHGAFQGGWVWEKIIPTLIQQGHRVFSPSLDLSVGLTDHIASIINLIDYNALTEITLIGHSYGGMVISGVAKERSQVIRHLFYLDAPIAENNQSLLDALGEATADFFYKSAIEQEQELFILPFPLEAFGIFDEENTQWIANRHQPQALKSFTDKVSIFSQEQSASMQIGYIHCKLNNPYTDAQAAKAKTRGWKVLVIEAPHCPMITHPEALLKLIETEICSSRN